MAVLEKEEVRELAAVAHTLRATKVIDFLTDYQVKAGGSVWSQAFSVDGYEHLNLFIEFPHESATAAGVDAWVDFGFLDSRGLLQMFNHQYINLEENASWPQKPQLCEVSGNNTWPPPGSAFTEGRYVIRVPILGPYATVAVMNQDMAHDRKISAWAYLVS